MIRKWSMADEVDHIINVWGGLGTFKAYNTEEYYLVPKDGVIERQIKEKEEALSRLKQRKANEQKFYENQEKTLTLEIEMLKQKLSG